MFLEKSSDSLKKINLLNLGRSLVSIFIDFLKNKSNNYVFKTTSINVVNYFQTSFLDHIPFFCNREGNLKFLIYRMNTMFVIESRT